MSFTVREVFIDLSEVRIQSFESDIRILTSSSLSPSSLDLPLVLLDSLQC